jgi:hypothetical protein
VAQVLPDGRLYSAGETYDDLADLSASYGLSGNPWSTWVADVDDGRIAMDVLRDLFDGT